MSRALNIFVSVAEDSADMHAAALMRHAASHLPQAHFYGLTGPRMRALGAETVFDMAAHAAMLAQVFAVVGKAIRAVRAAEAAWRTRPPDVALLIDSPELNLRIAARAKRLGIPVLYYIAPQTWASRSYRNQAIARDVDRLACILPFEQAYFRRAEINAEFVGHPLFESLTAQRATPERVQSLRLGGAPLVALLPGSRRHVIEKILPQQLDVLDRVAALGQPLRAAISAVDQRRAGLIREIVARREAARCAAQPPFAPPPGFTPAAPIEIVIDDNASLLTAADLVLVASGTATLHVAYYRKPMIVLYDAGWLFNVGYRCFGRWLLHTPHLSLVNILSGVRLVPEFMPYVRDLDEVARTAARLLVDKTWRQSMSAGLDALVQPLERSHASRRVCDLLVELAGPS